MMAEKEYIEREAFKAEIRRLSTHYLNEWDTLGVLAAADRIPAADVRPVVLCRDCVYSYDSVGGWCCSHGICVDCIVREDFFCADGEKREES
jgi:hypothetical protein